MLVRTSLVARVCKVSSRYILLARYISLEHLWFLLMKFRFIHFYLALVVCFVIFSLAHI